MNNKITQAFELGQQQYYRETTGGTLKQKHWKFENFSNRPKPFPSQTRTKRKN